LKSPKEDLTIPISARFDAGIGRVGLQTEGQHLIPEPSKPAAAGRLLVVDRTGCEV